jgi:hypothetical protein
VRGGALPPALLFAALGLALAFAPRQMRAQAIVALTVAAAAMIFAPVPTAWREGVFLGCWLSVIATAAAVHLPGGPSRSLTFALSLNAGIWAGAVIVLAGSRLDLLKAAPGVLLVIPAVWLVGRDASITVKVAASWLIAMAALAAMLAFLPVTPGYLPDHLD